MATTIPNPMPITASSAIPVSIQNGGGSIKLSSKISVAVGGYAGTLYTVPANSYLVLWYLQGFGLTYGNQQTGANVYVDGVAIASAGSGSAVFFNGVGFIVGPGAVISWDSNGQNGPFGNASLRGTLFVNS